jgi:hypothetical protein
MPLAQVRVVLGCWRAGHNGVGHTRSWSGRRPSNLLPPSAQEGIWRWATREAPRQPPSQTLPRTPGGSQRYRIGGKPQEIN